MATIKINDLADSFELDSEAMTVIYGGAASSKSRAKLKLGLRNKNKSSLMDQARESQRRMR